MTSPKNLPPFAAHADGNQNFTVLGVVGTLGTSDVGGTAAALPIGVNASTGAMYVQDLSGASGTTNIQGTVAVSSVVPGTAATNLGKAEDSQHSSGDVGVMALAVRNDAGTTLAGSDLDYYPLTTDASGALRVDLNGVVSTNNSTTGTLGIGGVFTGSSDDAINYNEIRVSIIASHASATDGLSLQQSSDNSNWDITDTYTIPATTGKTYSVPRQARYIRVVYTNGGVTQTSFRMQTILNRLGARVSSQKASDAYTNETDLEQQQSFNMLLNSGTTWDRARGTLGTAFVAAAAGTLNSVAIHNGTLGTAGTASDGAQGTLRVDANEALWVNLGYKLDSTNDSITSLMPSGTLTTGTLQNLVTGTINAIAAGTITGGTLQNLTSGTINALASGTITTGTVSVTTGTMVLNTGTITTIAAGTQNTLGTVGVVNNIVTGTLANSGTTTGVGVVTTVSNLTNGSVNILTGTVSVNQTPLGSSVLSYGTLGTTGAAVFGTLLSAVGAGTNIYLTGITMVVQSGTVDLAVANGTGGPATGPGGLNTYARGLFPIGGGMREEFSPVIKSGTNGTLVYWMGGAGTAYFTAQYWVGP